MEEESEDGGDDGRTTRWGNDDHLASMKPLILILIFLLRSLAVLQDGDQGDERGEQKRRVHAVATQHVLAQMARDVFATNVRHVRECLRYEKP